MTKRNRTAVTVVAIALLSVAILAAWWLGFRQAPLPEGLVQANGRIEGDHYTVASKVPGRIVELKAREGDAVEGRQVLARLDDAQLRARVDQAQAAGEARGAQLEAARTALATLKKQVPLQVDTARAGVAHAEAALAAAGASMEQAGRDARRFENLLKKRSVDKESAEQKALAWKVARAEYATAMAALTQAQKRLAEAELGWEQVEAREQEVVALGRHWQRRKACWMILPSVRRRAASSPLASWMKVRW